jgi:hypothetical protein
MGKSNGVESIERPLKHRPDVIVVKSGGTLHVLGDGKPLTQEELLAINGGLTREDRNSMRNFGLNPNNPRDLEKWLRRNEEL